LSDAELKEDPVGFTMDVWERNILITKACRKGEESVTEIQNLQAPSIEEYVYCTIAFQAPCQATSKFAQ